MAEPERPADAPLRVLRITPRFDWRAADPAPPDVLSQPVGGHAVQVRRIAAGTAALGVQQTIATIRPPGAARRATAGPGVAVEALGPAGVAGVHRSNGAWLGALFVALPRLRRAPPDVVHVHASGIVEPLLAALAARLVLRRPLVLTLHCSARATYVATSRIDAVVLVLTRAAERAAMRAAARTLVLTELVRAALGGGRIEVAPDCVEPDAYAVDPAAVDAFSRRVGLPEGVPVAAFVGRLSAEKGWPDLLELAARVERLHVLVCGTGADREPMLAAVRERGLAERFTFAGAVPAADVPLALARADAVVLPSRHEELGSVLVEAMAAGVPSVAYGVGGVPEAVVDGLTGLLVAPGDVAALAGAVARAVADDDLRAAAREAGPRRARERHGVEAASRRLVELYRELAA